MLGWSPKVSAEEGLALTIESFRRELFPARKRRTRVSETLNAAASA
jgi:dTDP-glucose 4,6-dehydratase/UDP-glucuronate decarboxylase